ncbi:hypothetical protein F441_16868 [Phytophthora nicotianae CJ01A1]|uniref:Thioredoxin domain-containing protein n=4 Tax=Phytophthora nicotianae TaxID=4792 RepID=W2YL19_PHYNI|nr:hypothetical protein L915_16540 [Phytophthora nicotianae]ETO65716.1 hypothetical protein F444_17039 [Phytophthora nicotianae P1976]ETP06817.1 hypothetical protein F441_16868 [Phytophthora nicotianae CJ01A1]ETP34899.1 hypothetical protein F442_16862 [Phytophthora nicotianae P10297]ETL30624.1 hypothetical protein L916_16442 [Phytophthora nicotianae]
MKAPSREEPKPWSLNPVRFMQLALAVTMFLSVSYMWQFTAETVVSPTTEEIEAGNAKDAAAKLVQAAEAALAVQRDRSHAHTQYVVRGFEEAHKFVREYDVESMGPLFVLFMSDTDANGTYWFQPCQMVKDAVHKGFKRAPRRSRLLEIQVGSEKYWNDLMNPFRQNQLFYIDYLPTLMRYDGGGNSSALLAGPNCLNQDLLDVVFQVNKPAAGKPHNNRIMHFNNMKQVLDFLAFYDYSYPLFMFFVSGVHAFNNRLWCPFCDKAEVPVMHYYNYTAPDNAVLLRIVVAREPRQWFDEDNDFVGQEFSEKVVEFDGVPYLGFVDRNRTSNKIKLREFTHGMDQHEKLQEFFRQKAPGAAVAPAP